MAIIKDIAELANCSIATVSRVLNLDETLRVSDELKQNILKIAEELQYKSKSQRKHKSKYKIAVISMYTKHEEIEDPFYLSIRLGVEMKIQGKNIELVVLNDLDGVYDFDLIKGVEGIICIGHFTRSEIAEFEKFTENIVFVNSNPFPKKYDSVLFDGENAVDEALNHLYENGHRDIGYIGVKSIRESKMVDLAEHRYDLVTEKLMELRVYNEKRIYRGGKTFQDGHDLMNKIIASGDLPSAFFIGNDSMCIGALNALFEAGIQVPSQISLVGYNDISSTEYVNPPLTTVKVFTEMMGELAVTLLLECMSDRTIPIRIITPTTLIQRHSVARIE